MERHADDRMKVDLMLKIRSSLRTRATSIRFLHPPDREKQTVMTLIITKRIVRVLSK